MVEDIPSTWDKQKLKEELKKKNINYSVNDTNLQLWNRLFPGVKPPARFTAIRRRPTNNGKVKFILYLMKNFSNILSLLGQLDHKGVQLAMKLTVQC